MGGGGEVGAKKITMDLSFTVDTLVATGSLDRMGSDSAVRCRTQEETLLVTLLLVSPSNNRKLQGKTLLESILALLLGRSVYSDASSR